MVGGGAARFETAFTVPWGAGGLPEFFVESAQLNIVTANAPRPLRAALRVRLGPGGSFLLLSADPALGARPGVVDRYSEAGERVARIEVEAPGMTAHWNVTDFVVDDGGSLYLLETTFSDDGSRNHLRKLDSNGRTIWSRTGPRSWAELDVERLAGVFTQLVVDGSADVFLPATSHRGLVARVDPDDGGLEPAVEWGEWTGEVFADAGGAIHFIRYEPEEGRRLWQSIDLATGEQRVRRCDEALDPFLMHPFGVDARPRLYCGSGWMAVSIAENGSLVWRDQFENIVVSESGDAVWTSSFDPEAPAEGIRVRVWDRGSAEPREIRLTLPAHVLDTPGWWRLSHRDGEGRLIVHGGETPQKEGVLLVYSGDGTLEREAAAPEDLHLREFTLQERRTWAVGADGTISLPVLGPDGFHVVERSQP